MVTFLDDMGLGAFSLTGFEQWLILGMNVILSTIVSGIVLMVVVGIIGRKYGDGVEFGNAFMMALAVNLVNFLGVVGLMGMFLPIPYLSILLPLIVWTGLAKMFFSEMDIKHILIVAVIGYALSILVVPPITAMIMGFIPI